MVQRSNFPNSDASVGSWTTVRMDRRSAGTSHQITEANVLGHERRINLSDVAVNDIISRRLWSG